jgi:drug/metabolite transporter (DMT)-like permease
LFDSFGTPISPLTQFVLKAPNLWWVIAAPAVAVFLWIAFRPRVTETERRRMKAAVIGVVLFGAAVYGLVAYALYSPLFKLGGAI